MFVLTAFAAILKSLYKARSNTQLFLALTPKTLLRSKHKTSIRHLLVAKSTACHQ